MRNAFLILALTTLLAAGCGQGGFSKRTQQTQAGVLRYAIPSNPTTLDPHVVQDGDTIDALMQVYEGLVGWGTDNKPTGLLAEKWDIEDGGRTYVFTLKAGAKFHNGREVTAEDFKWSIERATNPELKSPIARSYLGDIVGVVDKLERRATEVAGVQARDPRTVVIRIDKPRPYFLGKLTYLVSAVLPKDGVPLTEIRKPEEMIGTGPFRVTRYEPTQLMVLEANAGYHEGAPKLARIERPVIGDALTRLNMYRAGNLDLLQLERQDVAVIQKDAALGGHLVFHDRPSLFYVGMNQLAYPPFKDARVRRAIAMAIDKKVVVDEILGGVNQIANSLVPPGIDGHRADAPALAFDPVAAQRLLAEAGFPGGKGLPQLTLFYRGDRPDVKLASEAIAVMLDKNLGVKVTLQDREWRAYLEAHNAKELGFFHMRWMADYLDAENFLSFLLATYGPENKVGYSNPEFDALTGPADVMLDGAERVKLYERADAIALNDAAIVPIYYQRDAELVRPRVKGLRDSVFGHLPHTTTTVSDP